MSYKEIVEDYKKEFANAMTEEEYRQFIQTVKDNRLALDMYEWQNEPIGDNWNYEKLY